MDTNKIQVIMLRTPRDLKKLKYLRGVEPTVWSYEWMEETIILEKGMAVYLKFIKNSSGGSWHYAGWDHIVVAQRNIRGEIPRGYEMYHPRPYVEFDLNTVEEETFETTLIL